MGIVTAKVMRSETGCAIWRPKRPSVWERIVTTGPRTSPKRQAPRIVALHICPEVWSMKFVIMEAPVSAIENDASRSVSVPTATTSGSSRKKPMRFGAEMQVTMPMARTEMEAA